MIVERPLTKPCCSGLVVNNILKELPVVKKQRSSHILNATLILQDKCQTNFHQFPTFIIFFLVAIRTGPVHRLVFAIHTGF